MSNLLTNLFGKSQRVKANQRKTRLGVEALEARDLMSVGPEFHINTETIFDQNQVAVASQPTLNGRRVAVWTSVNEIGSGGQNIKAQIFADIAGGKVGGEITVAGIRFINENEPSVAMDALGNFVVVWTEETLGQGSDTMIRAQRFFASGAKNGGVMTIVNSARREFSADVAMDQAGNFVVSYGVQFSAVDQDIHARRFASNGAFLGETAVAVSSLSEHAASIARSPDGRFSVAYAVNQPSGGVVSIDVHLRRFSSAGALASTHFIATSGRHEFNPDVAMDRSGNAVVVYEDSISSSVRHIKARKVFSNAVLGTTMNVDSSSNVSFNPAVAMDRNDGDFVVAYESRRKVPFLPITLKTLMVREMNATGTLKASTSLGNVGFGASLSIDDSDRYFMGYTSTQRADDSGLGIRGRRGLLV